MQYQRIYKFSAWALLIVLFSGLNPQLSRAAFEQTTLWSDLSDLDLREALRSQYGSAGNLLDPNIKNSSLEVALSDADSLVKPEFKVPQDLRENVRFWLRIYTELTTQHVAIFDARHPAIVYEVLDFRDLAKTARNQVVYEITVEKRVKAAMAAYRKGLLHLAKHPAATQMPNGQTREIQGIKQALARLKHKHSLTELAKHIRSQTGQRDNIVKGLLAAEAFFPKMEEIFRQLDVPSELTRLTLVESSFNLHAKSRVGAAGIWQFMPNPGKKFLRIESPKQIDERLSPLKATAAAAGLLKESYQRFKNWPLTVTAYNHGLRGLPRGRKGDTSDFARIAHFFDACNASTPLGWAARNYYSEFLAVLHAEAYRKMFYGEPPVSTLKPVAYRVIQSPIHAAVFAKNAGMSISEFALLNPDVQNLSRRLPKGFYVAVPGDTKEDDLNPLLRLGRRKSAPKKRIKLAQSDIVTMDR